MSLGRLIRSTRSSRTRGALALAAATCLLAAATAPAAVRAQSDPGRGPGGTITTVAGMGRYNGDGQLGKDATLTLPFGQGVTGAAGHPYAGLAVDGAGNLYLADRGNNRVRKVSLGPDGTTLSGAISTVAGNGALATAGDGGPAVRASLYNPAGLAVAPDGTLYVAEGAPTTPVTGMPDQPASRLGYPFDRPVAPAEPVAALYGRRVRKIAPDGTISTVAGTGVPGATGDGGPATQARLLDPAGLALLGDGSLLIADAGAGRVRRLAPDGTLQAFAGRGVGGTAAAAGSAADNAPLPATDAVLLRPTGVAVGPDGTVYIAERGAHRVRVVDKGGTLRTFAGSGLRALDTSFIDPLDAILQKQFGVLPGGALNVSTRFGEFDPRTTPKLADNCTGTAVAPEPFCPPAQTDAWGARLNAPAGVAVAPDGTVYVADTNDNLVRRVTDQATTERLFGLTGRADGDKLKSLKDAFGRPVPRIATVAGVRAGTLTLPVNTGTGAGDLEGTVAVPGFPPGFRVPVGPAEVCPTCTVAVGLGGFRYGDSGSTDGQEAIYTELRAPQAVAVAPGGVLYVLDQGNNRVLRIADGRARRVAGAYNGDGGAARSTQLMHPRGVAFGPDGAMYVADSDRSVVRRVSPDGATVAVVAGSGTRGDGGDGGPATRAQLAWPTGLAVARDGSVYIADRGAHRVRKVAPDGTISTVAGTGEAGFRAARGVDPEGAPAATQPLDSPAGVALAADGTLYIADTFNNLVRKVTPDGRLYTVAGTGAAEYTGDSGERPGGGPQPADRRRRRRRRRRLHRRLPQRPHPAPRPVERRAHHRRRERRRGRRRGGRRRRAGRRAAGRPAGAQRPPELPRGRRRRGRRHALHRRHRNLSRGLRHEVHGITDWPHCRERQGRWDDDDDDAGVGVERCGGG